ncbi:hypothetical protein GF319_08500 [Candidatus Bathyarchaeota archaeon]|nr:hypothetical protein [Candidatus Bathyarchaeota archaeon]
MNIKKGYYIITSLLFLLVLSGYINQQQDINSEKFEKLTENSIEMNDTKTKTLVEKENTTKLPTIIYSETSTNTEILAAKEVRRYLYLRTNEILTLKQVKSLPETGDLILVATDNDPMVDSLRSLINHNTNREGFIIKTVESDGRNILIITGYDATSTLYAAYRFAEHLGIGFDLTGDAIPDKKIDLDITGFDEMAEPRFRIRGIHPFHNMMSGPDNWHTSDYMVIMSQLAKMGMNFIGLHTYGDAPEGAHNEGDGPDPQVWIGLEEDINPDGTVKWSSPAYNAHTHRVKNNGEMRIWGYDTWDTDQFSSGASEVFATNGWGNDMMGSVIPNQDDDIDGWNQIYNRYGKSFNKSFSFGRELGVKTAIGLEMTLTKGEHPIISYELRARLDNPTSDETIKNIYKGVFTRIKRTHPLDYFWLWTDENDEVTEEDAISEVPLAIQAYNEIGGADFEIAFAGWTTPSFLESISPDSAFSGYCSDGYCDGFEELKTSKKWPITWGEEDWGVIQPQTEVLHTVQHAKAARDLDSEGYLIQIWGSRAPSKEINTMRLMHWAYGTTGSPVDKGFASNDDSIVYSAYLDWSTKQFGHEVAQQITDILAPLDLAYYGRYDNGGLPTPTFWASESSDWAVEVEEADEDSENLDESCYEHCEEQCGDDDDCYDDCEESCESSDFEDEEEIEEENGEWDVDEAPGAIMANDASWSTEKNKYAFVDQLEDLRSEVVGVGNLERYDYLLKSMQALRLYGEYGTVRGAFEAAMKNNDYSTALKHRKNMARLFEKIVTLKLESITNNNELGEISNIEILNWKQLMINKWDSKLRKGLGGSIPSDANPSKTYMGEAFVKVVPARTVIKADENLKLNVLVMGTSSTPKLKYRTIGDTDWSNIPLVNVARSVYEVTIPAQSDDFEYYIESGNVTFPVTAPNMYHTVVVLK